MFRTLCSRSLALFALTACGEPEVVLPEVLTALAVFPSHGSVEISTQVEPYVYFSQAVKAPVAAADALSLACVGAPPCGGSASNTCPAQPAVEVHFGSDAQVARMVPSAPLAPNTCYVVIVGAGIEASDEDVGPLPVELRALFQTH